MMTLSILSIAPAVLETIELETCATPQATGDPHCKYCLFDHFLSVSLRFQFLSDFIQHLHSPHLEERAL